MGKRPTTAPRTTSIQPSSLASSVTAFAPSTSSGSAPEFYAHLHRAPDAHTLRVYAVASGKCISRWSSAGSTDDDRDQVNAVEWVVLPSAEQPQSTADDPKRGKKRRTSDGASDALAAQPKHSHARPAVVLGLASGKLLLWSPNGSTAAPAELAHASCTSPVTALSSPQVATGAPAPRHVWSAHEDGYVRVWDLLNSTLVGQALVGEAGKALDSIAVRYVGAPSSSDKQLVHLLAARLSITAYSLSLSLSASKKDKIRDLKTTELGRATGHVEKAFARWVASLVDESAMEDDEEALARFLSFSATDRFVQLWELSSSRPDAALVARLAVDSGVAAVAISPSATLAALDVSGSLAVSSIPAAFESASAAGKKSRKSSGIATLEPSTEVVGRGGEPAAINAAALAGSELIISRGGVKPVFESIALDQDGVSVPRVELDKIGSALSQGIQSVEASASAPAPTRYTEPLAAAQRTGEAIAELDSDEELANDGELDVDLAEPTLAERLKSLNVAKKANKAAARKGDDSDDEDVDSEEEDDDEDESDDEDEDEDEDAVSGGAVPATTLTTTLLQSLHSSDAPLLESCLAHTNPTLIRATVKRLPSGGLVLALLEALVERLGKAKGGKQGTAGVKRSRGLIEWVRQVLVVHVGFLVTIPSLVTRLATLHASLTSRLALQPTLLALDGRLQLVMSQMELRRERNAAQRPAITAAKGKKVGRKYVEGESDESGSDEEGSEAGSIEDVVLGSGSEEDDDDEEDEDEFDEDEDLDLDDEDDEEDDEDDDAPKSRKVNGRGVADLLDLEASEDDGSEEDSEPEDDEEESD